MPQKAVFCEYERVQKKGKFMLSTLKDLWYDGKNGYERETVADFR